MFYIKSLYRLKNARLHTHTHTHTSVINDDDDENDDLNDDAECRYESDEN